MNIQIIEKYGVVVKNKEIKLGQEVEIVMSQLEEGEVFNDTYYFYDSNLAIFSERGLISYIELRGGQDSDICAMFHGVDLFQCEKKKALEILETNNRAALKQDEMEYIAENLGITVSSGISKEEVDELERLAKKDGVYEKMLEDINKERYRSEHLEIIGITCFHTFS